MQLSAPLPPRCLIGLFEQLSTLKHFTTAERLTVRYGDGWLAEYAMKFPQIYGFATDYD